MGRVRGLTEKYLYGVLNIGMRPTVCGKTKLLEIHLLDFDADIYGKCISVEFLHKLRDEKKFDSIDELFAQVAKDEKMAREFSVIASEAKQSPV